MERNAMARAIGIDLGTTNSAVAIMGDAGVAEIVPNAEGKPTTPSVVLFKNSGGDDRTVVGQAARRQASVRPDDVVEYVKRFIGDPSWRFDSSNDNEYRAEDVSAIILRHLVDAAAERLGEEIRDVVVTVPAYFDDSRRTATKEAGTIAGLNVLRVLNEPTAAALAYGVSAENDGHVLVYDLGGGTFDVTILGIENRTFEVLATDGDRNLGGFDWDNELMKLTVAELEQQHGLTDFYDDVEAVAVLRAKAELAKRALSASERATIELALDSGDYRIEVTREQFEEATSSLLRRTQEIVEDTLDESGLDWDDIDQVLLVGGSTRMPAVHDLVRRLSGRAAADGVNPDEVVALGAAIQAVLTTRNESAAPLGDVRVHDVTSHALGTTVFDVDEERKVNAVIIPRNTKIPASGEQELFHDNPVTQVSIDLTQGDDPDPEFVTTIGESTIELDEEWPAGTRFRLVYSYDVDQTVHVEIFRLPSGESAGAFAIERVANMTQDEIVASATKVRSVVTGSAAPSAPQAKPVSGPVIPTAAPASADAAASASTAQRG